MPVLHFTTENDRYPYGTIRPTLGEGLSVNRLSTVDSLSFRHHLDREAFTLPQDPDVYLAFAWNLVPPFWWGHSVEILGAILDEIQGLPGVRNDCLKGIRDCVRHHVALNQGETSIDSGYMKMALTYLPPHSPAWVEAEHAGALRVEGLDRSRHIVWVEKREIAWAI